MDQLVHRLRRDHPNLVFTTGEAHCWSPERNQIFYAAADEQINVAGLLHELGHARLGHHSFTSDMDLLQKEVDAWQEAACLGRRYGVAIDQEHIEECLDSYRDWLYHRSHCPKCRATGVQQTVRRYVCLNCSATWEVSGSRMRRSYRRQLTHKK
jgi:hypothetical protein